MTQANAGKSGCPQRIDSEPCDISTDGLINSGIRNRGKRLFAFENLLRFEVKRGTLTDIAQRTALYLKAQQIFKREQPFTPIAYPAVYQPIRRNVTGFRINPLGTTRFSSVGLSHD